MSENPQGNTQSPMMLLYQLAIGHFTSRALALVAKLAIADKLSPEGSTVEELARATDTNPAALRRVLRLVVSAGIFEEDAQGRFRLNDAGRALQSDVPGSMRAMVSVFAGENIQRDWDGLEYCVRTGLPAFKQADPDADPFTAMSRDPEAEATFDKAMSTFAPQIAAAVAAAYDFSQFGTLVDVGGGNGTLLDGILKGCPKLRGVLFDRPAVAERARVLDRAHRLEITGGNFFESVPAGHDAYLLKHVIHDWNDDDARKILAVCRKAMPSHAKLLLVEGVYPAQIVQSVDVLRAVCTDVNMLVCTGGLQRSEAEFRQLLSAAGFEPTRFVPTQARVTVIEAVPR